VPLKGSVFTRSGVTSRGELRSSGVASVVVASA
jgi:hypothetical protein